MLPAYAWEDMRKGIMNFEDLTDIELLALCIYGEARGEPYAGQCGVGFVVINRTNAKRYGRGIKGVILKPWQFSCFNKSDPNRKKLQEFADDISLLDEKYLDIASVCIDGIITSPVDGATHYHTKSVTPSWKDKLTYICTIGNHLFYKEE
jgi:spore germination cell wall hydrolase CwlJ-like protein